MTISIVAHRGDCQKHFENTLQSIEAAISQGIILIEIDIQISKDGIPVLYHDRNLLRMTGFNSPVAFVNHHALQKLELLRREENINKQNNVFISALLDVVLLIKKYPKVTLFVEVKRVNFLYFSYQYVFNQLMQQLTPILPQVVIISFSYRFLRLCRKLSSLPLGFVLPHWQSYSTKMQEKLQPKFIYCDIEFVPADHIFVNEEHLWVLYEVAKLQQVKHFNDRGAICFETFFPTRLKEQLLTARMLSSDAL